MVASPKGNRASARTNLRVLWQIYNIFTVTYTVWMVLVPKERTCSKLHDNYKNIYNVMVFITNNEGKRSVLELRANPVVGSKEATLERADFQAGWSELSWSGRAQPVLA